MNISFSWEQGDTLAAMAANIESPPKRTGVIGELIRKELSLKNAVAELVRVCCYEDKYVREWVNHFQLSGSRVAELLKSCSKRTLQAMVQLMIEPNHDFVEWFDLAINENLDGLGYGLVDPLTIKQAPFAALEQYVKSVCARRDSVEARATEYCYRILRYSFFKTETDYVEKVAAMRYTSRHKSAQEGGKLHRIASQYPAIF